MDIQQTPEEKLKTIIYDIYTGILSETVSDRRQVYIGQIWEKIVLWWNKFNYHEMDANEMGVEIFNIIKRLVKDNNDTAKNKSEFFYILREAMKNAEKEYIRKYGQGSINIPREKIRKLKELNKLIRKNEDELGRKLNNDEEERCITKWFKKQEYIDLLNAKKVSSISFYNKDDETTDNIDIADPHSFDQIDEDYIYDSFDEFIKRTNTEYVIEAVKFLLQKKKKTRDYYKELITLHCIKKDLKELYHILDQDIIDSFHKNDIKPKQYEIYQKYHPNAQKSGAEAMASANLRDFLKDIDIYLKAKNQ